MAGYRPRGFSEYIQMIWRRRLTIFLVLTILFVSALIVISRIPGFYESHASVVVVGPQDDRSVSSRATSTIERLNSRAFLSSVAEKDDPYPNRSLDSQIRGLQRDMKVDTRYRGDFPELITVSYRHRDPAVAKQVASDLAAAFSSMNEAIENQLNKDELAADAQLAELENRGRQLGEARAASASRRTWAMRAASQSNMARAERIATASSVEQLTDKQYALTQQIAEQKRQIAEQQKIAQSPSVTEGARASGSYGVLLVRKAELEAQLKEFSAEYTDKNPKVAQVKSQLAAIEHQISQLSSGTQDASINTPEAREVRSMQRELSRMQTELDITNRELERKKQASGGPINPGLAAAGSAAAVPAVDDDASASPGSIGLQARFNALLTQKDNIQKARQIAAGLDPGVFQIVDTPVEGSAPVGPNRFRLGLIAFLAAIGIALLVAIVREARQLVSISDDRDVAYYLGSPVVALIPETLTSEEQGRARRLSLIRGLAVLAVSVAAIPVMVVVLNYLQLFQVLASR
ncbi:MAG TPA: hypothetical protein VN345_05030 [Blastocatellia bacterium]|nr:hypothetical protein [Blastocatellia bacterium]